MSHAKQLAKALLQQMESEEEPTAPAGAPCRPNAPAASTSCLQQLEPSLLGFSAQHQLAVVQRERDAALAREAQQLRQAQAAAAGEASRLGAALAAAQAECARLRQQRAEGELHSEQRISALASEAAAKGEALERLQAAHAEMQAASEEQACRVGLLQTQLRVLLECYRQLEGERLGTAGSSSSCSGACPGVLVQRRPNGGQPPLPAGVQCLEHLASSHSHLELACRCAELEWALEEQRREGASAVRATKRAEEQAAALRLLLAQAGGGGGGGGATALQQQQLEAAQEQLREARRVGEEMRGQAEGRERALQRALGERQKLQQDVSLMVGARDAIAALKASLQQVAAA